MEELSPPLVYILLKMKLSYQKAKTGKMDINDLYIVYKRLTLDPRTQKDWKKKKDIQMVTKWL